MERKLTKGEEKRKKIFEEQCQEMMDKGYEKKELKLNINEVNSILSYGIFGMVLL